MLLTTKLTPDMGLQIYKYLSNLELLPSDGVLAGQSVVTALLNLYGKGQSAPINDLDIYKLADKEDKNRPLNLSFRPEYAEIEVLESSFKDTPTHTRYGGLLKFFHARFNQGFEILKVENKSLLNLITIKPIGEYGEITPLSLLATFDLNMVKTAVDLKTKKLYWTKDFEFFIRTAQLEVSNTVSPFHTVCRIEKKLNEMPWLYTDRDLNYRTLLFPYLVQSTIEAENLKKFGTYFKDKSHYFVFGDKYNNMYAGSNELKKLFTCDTTFKPADTKANLYKVSFSDTFLSHMNMELFNNKLDTLRTRTSESCLFEAASAVSPTIMRNENIYTGKRYNYNKTIMAEAGQLALNQSAILDQSYLTGQVQPRWAEKIEKLLIKHPDISSLFLGKSLDIQSKIYTNLKLLEKTHGESIIGFMEVSKVFTTDDILEYTNFDRICTEYIKELSIPFDNYKPLRFKTNNSIVISDLDTPLKIKVEGSQMRHCVGGYAQSVRTNRCRILSLVDTKNPSVRSTVELNPITQLNFSDNFSHRRKSISNIYLEENTEPAYTIAQHRAFANKDPDPRLATALSDSLLRYNASKLNLKNEYYLKVPFIRNPELLDYSTLVDVNGVSKHVHVSYISHEEAFSTYATNSRYYSSKPPPIASIRVSGLTDADITLNVAYDSDKLNIYDTANQHHTNFGDVLLQKEVTPNESSTESAIKSHLRDIASDILILIDDMVKSEIANKERPDIINNDMICQPILEPVAQPKPMTHDDIPF